MENEENQRQVSLVSHSPWKSQTTRFPHSNSPGEARKSGKPNPGFPLSRFLFYLSQKGDPAIASLRFRLILRLENAVTAAANAATEPTTAPMVLAIATIGVSGLGLSRCARMSSSASNQSTSGVP